MKKLIPGMGKKAAGPQEETRIDAEGTEAPIRVMIGTCPGSKKDAEALVEALVERYFDIPSDSWYYLRREGRIGYHYEIHEGGEGIAYLPDIIKALEGDAEEVIVGTLSDRNLRVVRKANHHLASAVLTEQESRTPVTPGIRRSARMTPIASDGSEWMRVGVTAFSLGLLAFTSAGVLHKGISLEANGFYEAANEISTSRVASLIRDPADPLVESAPASQLPMSQWTALVRVERTPSEYVAALRFDGESWTLETGEPFGFEPPDDTETPPDPTDVAPEDDPAFDPEIDAAIPEEPGPPGQTSGREEAPLPESDGQPVERTGESGLPPMDEPQEDDT
jgi:hypothetical protein